jgi:hypothetical protein
MRKLTFLVVLLACIGLAGTARADDYDCLKATAGEMYFGEDYKRDEDYKRALLACRKAAEGGNELAAYKLGLWYRGGGGRQDDAEAASLGGHNAATFRGGSLRFTFFESTDAELAGILVGAGGELDLNTGFVRNCEIGAAINVPGYDLSRLRANYYDNGVNMQSSDDLSLIPHFCYQPASANSRWLYSV